MIGIRIRDPRSSGTWCLQEFDEFTLGKDSSVGFISQDDPRVLVSLFLTRIIPKNPTIHYKVLTYSKWSINSKPGFPIA